MEQLNFSIQIKAPKEMVWKALWEDKTNREWTAVFSEGSYAVSSWEEGSKVLFLSPWFVAHETIFFNHHQTLHTNCSKS